MRISLRLVDRHDDDQFGVVGRYDAHEPGDVAVARIASELDIQFLGGARLTRDRDVGQGGEAPGPFGTDDTAHHVERASRRVSGDRLAL